MALSNIIASVQDESASFVAPGATVDNFSKVSHRSDIYLALFRPGATPAWTGNLKRYDYSGNPASLRDENKNPAVDPNTGNFYDTARSAWSNSADGNFVAKGGAAGRLNPASRNVYTYTGESDNLTLESNRFSADNAAITLSDLGLGENDTAIRTKILDWAVGYDVNDEDEDNATDDARLHIGDPLHSRPVIVTYGGDSETPNSVIFFGTNDGYLHAIKTDTGDEVFSFIPTELIPNLKPLYENIPVHDKIYGLDGALTLWTEDKDGDGTIDSDDDHVYLYAGMRRGGNNYYALDVTDKDAPEFKWQIPGTSTEFGELGQTWSQALPITIKYNGTNRKVLLFGGGYDATQDDNNTRAVDSVGRAIYIVDADDGELLWSGGPADGTETRSFDDMTYSFPATPRAVDINGDGVIQQFYIGDMGGRIWRFDINDEATDNTELIDGGIIADLSTDGIIADTRRFYHTPDLSLSTINGKHYINIAVGSGYQAHPLNTGIEDRFYLIRYPLEFAGAQKYGIPDTAETTGDEAPDYVPIVESDLFNATSNILGEGTDPDVVSAAEESLATSHGWYLNMELSGEKVLGSSITFDNKIFFASYVPGAPLTGCAPEIGRGIFWGVNLWDGTPVSNLADDGAADLTKEDRTRRIPGGGIPAPIQIMFIDAGNVNEEGEVEDNELQILAISGPNNMLNLDPDSLVRRVYWSEYPNF